MILEPCVWFGVQGGGLSVSEGGGWVCDDCVGGSCRLGGRLRWMVMVDRGQRGEGYYYLKRG